MDEQLKKCNRCLNEYPATTEYFYTNKGKLILSYCKECKRKMRKKYKTNKETRRVYYWNNREKLLKYHKQWRDAKKLKEN